MSWWAGKSSAGCLSLSRKRGWEWPVVGERALLQALGAALHCIPFPQLALIPSSSAAQRWAVIRACRHTSPLQSAHLWLSLRSPPGHCRGFQLEYKVFQHTNDFHWCHQGHNLLRSFVSSLGCAIPPGVPFALISK